MADTRAELERLMRATLADQAQRHCWTYRAVRPLSTPLYWNEGHPVTGDCSKGVQWLCYWAKAPDPMANGWSSWGNSQTICFALHHLGSASVLLVGDVITFGRDGSEHAAMVLEAGSDPLVWSFGHQGAPNSYRLSVDHREHQYLRLPVVASVPSHEDELRAQTDWFSWIAWIEGEGDWKPYGKANAKVRPNVSKLISPLWWQRRVVFLANRKKGNKES